MKPLLKIMAVLALIFVSIFVLLNLTGVVTMARIEGWLLAAKNAHPFLVGLVVAVLLCIDLIIAVPTLATLLLAGYFIGPFYGALAGIIGLLASGSIGYWLSRHYGAAAAARIVKTPAERAKAEAMFRRHGPVMILLARAMPMLPEITSCMAGLTRMNFVKFIALWLANIIPYTALVAYAGSRSTLSDPTPALYMAISILVFLWLAWAFFNRRYLINR